MPRARLADIFFPPRGVRLLAGVLLALVGPLVATPIAGLDAMAQFRGTAYLVVVVLAAAVGRLAVALVAVVQSLVLLDYFHLAPQHTLRLRGSGLILFGLVAFIAALLVAERDRAAIDARRAAGRLSLLSRAGDLFAASSDPERTLQELGHVVVPELADRYSVHLVDPTGRISDAYVTHVDPEQADLAHGVRSPYPPPDPGAAVGVADAIRTGQPILIQDIADDGPGADTTDPTLRETLEDPRPRSVIVVPLIARGSVVGALQLVSDRSGRRYGADDLALAEEVAERAALAIDNALLHRERARIAEALQERLLPRRLPEIDGLEVAGRYRAGGEGIEVGGDFFDVFQIGERTWKALIGDVCGKGADAASLMGLFRYSARAIAREHTRPSQTLRSLNDLLLEEVGPEDGRFCTACFARITLRERVARITLCAAGHPLPFVVRADGDIEQVGTAGTLLGLFEEVSLTDEWVEIGPGDAFVMYTDGAVERADDPEWLTRGVPGLLARAAGRPADEIAQLLMDSAVEGPANRDDVAILVLKVPGGTVPTGDGASDMVGADAGGVD